MINWKPNNIWINFNANFSMLLLHKQTVLVSKFYSPLTNASVADVQAGCLSIVGAAYVEGAPQYPTVLVLGW